MNTDSFKGQVAIVTGAGQGIGFEICSQLASQGASVVLNDIDEKLTSSAVSKINTGGGNCIGLLIFTETITDLPFIFA